VSEPFGLTKSGGKLDIKAQWSSEGRPQGLFDLPYAPGQVLYAETTVTGKLAGTYRSMPFQPIPQTGTHVGIIVYPRVMFKFNMRAFIEDQLLAVQGRFTIENNSWTPYRANADGMLVPLPKGFKGGVIAEMNQADVAVVPGEGFRVMRPLAPGGGTSFVGGFSMSVDGGSVDWKLDLPLGTFASDLHIRETPGMTVKLPEGVRGKVKPGKDGNPYFMVEQITIPKGTSMTMSVHGLPSQPTWKVWVPRIVGILVVMVMLGGIGLALASKRTGAVPGMSARRGALLDALVELERTAGSAPQGRSSRLRGCGIGDPETWQRAAGRKRPGPDHQARQALRQRACPRERDARLVARAVDEARCARCSVTTVPAGRRCSASCRRS
jgi:hypothetical protein